MIDDQVAATYPAIKFIETKGYKRFVEFVEACRDYRYIGVCYGNPGVGKSLAAENYLKWDDDIHVVNIVNPLSLVIKQKIYHCKGVLITAPVVNTPKQIKENLIRKIQSFGRAYDMVRGEIDFITLATESVKLCHMVVIDEADRLTINSLEQVRDIYDEYKFGLVLIGMPGIEKRLSRYPQLYSRIGFCHEYEKLGQDEMRFILDQLWDDLGLSINQNKFSDVEAVNTFIRITDGNFRLIDRMFSQISRILKINNLESITKDVVNAARECLVIGANG